MQDLRNQIKAKFDLAEDKFEFINEIRDYLHDLSPVKCNPVDRVYWVPKGKVIANNYNPNHVAPKEMTLLHTSIKEDGYTQPIVTIYDETIGKYVVVDGFHRSQVISRYPDINEMCKGRLPIVVLNKSRSDRMASTVRHNRARGSHSVDGMVNIVYSMLKDKCSEKEICEKLGLEKKEFVKLMYITGFAKIFKDYEYSQAIEKCIKHSELEELDK